MNFGRAVKILLEKQGLTQKDLAKRTKISETSISLLLKGHTRPRKETLQQIATALNVVPEMLLLLSIDKDDVPEENRAMYDKLWPTVETAFASLFLK